MVMTVLSEKLSKNNRQRQPLLTTNRRSILQLLVEYHFLTTEDVHKELIHHALVAANYSDTRQTRRDLECLEIMGFIKSFAYEPALGSRSKYCWLLTSDGARAINFTNYGYNYRREPTKERLALQRMQLELTRQVTKAGEGGSGWQLIKPAVYNNVNKLPEITPQAEILIKAMQRAEYKSIQELEANDPTNPLLGDRWQRYYAQLYEAQVPTQPNDYLAYRQVVSDIGNDNNDSDSTMLQAAVLIICDPTAGPRFWKNRFKKYQKISSLIPVFGVFSTEQQARTYKPLLSKAGFRLTVVDRVTRLLTKLQE